MPSGRCDIPGCSAPATEKHHVSSYRDVHGQKNYLHLCKSEGPNHHDAAHQGSSKKGLVLWRKLPKEHRAEVPKIGREKLGMYRKTLRIDQQVEEAFAEARACFDKAMERWTPQESVDLGYPYIGGIDQSASVVRQLKSTLNSYEIEKNLYEHRTCPIQLQIDGQTANLYILPVYASSDIQARLEAISSFCDKFGKEQAVDQCGKIITEDKGKLSDYELKNKLSSK